MGKSRQPGAYILTHRFNPSFEKLLEYLKQERGFDFTGYKRSSLQRRILQRMQNLGVQEFDALDIGLPVEQLKRTIRGVVTGNSGYETFKIYATDRRGQYIELQGSTRPLYNRSQEISGVILILEPYAPHLDKI